MPPIYNWPLIQSVLGGPTCKLQILTLYERTVVTPREAARRLQHKGSHSATRSRFHTTSSSLWLHSFTPLRPSLSGYTARSCVSHVYSPSGVSCLPSLHTPLLAAPALLPILCRQAKTRSATQTSPRPSQSSHKGPTDLRGSCVMDRRVAAIALISITRSSLSTLTVAALRCSLSSCLRAISFYA